MNIRIAAVTAVSVALAAAPVTAEEESDPILPSPEVLEQLRDYAEKWLRDFADKAAYQVYADHPDHVGVIQQHIAPLLAGRAADQAEREELGGVEVRRVLRPTESDDLSVTSVAGQCRALAFAA